MTDKDKLIKILNDPILWMETFAKVVTKEGKLVPFKLNPQQKYLLKNTSKFNVVLKSRQLGISTVVNGYSLWLTHTHPYSNVLLMSHTDKSVSDIFRKLKVMYDNLPDSIRIPTINNNKTELVFQNGSRIAVVTCGTKDNGRGATLDFVHMSEVGFMEHFDTQMTSIEQALTADGMMILESTAHGLNHFSDLWFKVIRNEIPMWKPFFFGWVEDKKMFAKEVQIAVKAYVNTHGAPLTDEELDSDELALRERGASLDQLMWRRNKIASKGISIFHQEFPSTPIEAFVSSGANIFDTSKIVQRLNLLTKMKIYDLPKEATPLMRNHKRCLTIWRLPEKKRRYYLGVDTAEGLGDSNDYSVITVIDDTGFQCAEWRSNKVKPYIFAELVRDIGNFYNKGLLVVEKLSAGHTVVDKLHSDFHYVNMYKYKSYDEKSGKRKRKIGWETNKVSKPMMISNLQETFETGVVIVNSKTLLEEMKLFQLYGDKMQAPPGQHDDCVMAMAMAVEGLISKQYYYIPGRKK